MPRVVHLVVLLLMVLLVTSLEDRSESADAKIDSSLNNAGDLDTDASSLGWNSRHHGWKGGHGWNGGHRPGGGHGWSGGHGYGHGYGWGGKG